MNPLFAILAIVLLFTVCGRDNKSVSKADELMKPVIYTFSKAEKKLLRLIKESQDRVIAFHKPKPVKLPKKQTIASK